METDGKCCLQGGSLGKRTVHIIVAGTVGEEIFRILTTAVRNCRHKRKPSFTLFLREICENMKKKSYLCSMNVHFGLAIIDSNILAALGMQQILKDIVPTVDISIFISFAELQRADEGQFAHYFVASRIFFENAAFFRQHARRTIVLVNGELQIAGVPTLNVCQSEAMLAKTILNIHRMGHPQGHTMGHPGGLPTGHPEGLASPQSSPTVRTSWRSSTPVRWPTSLSILY